MKEFFKFQKESGLQLTYFKRERICPDCGKPDMNRIICVNPEHAVYVCTECNAMLKDKGNKTSWKCREW